MAYYWLKVALRAEPFFPLCRLWKALRKALRKLSTADESTFPLLQDM